MADEYDIGKVFKSIEKELIASMMHNMVHLRAEETEEGMNWPMWQAEQLKSLEKYKKENQKKFGKQFEDINSYIKRLIKTAKGNGSTKQEVAILDAMKNGFSAKKKVHKTAHTEVEFFRMNNRKLDALINATVSDMQKAETAVLRMANDQYRKIIFNAQVYANAGAGTYEKAVDMATKDFLASGLNCIEYANGARHIIADYADMAIRTASKRAYLQGEGEKRQEWGISTVIMNKRGNPCPKCLPFVGKVLIDDVWSGGSKKDGDYPLMSTAIAAGLYHPRCKDGHTTYFPGISSPPDDKYGKQELVEIEEKNKQKVRKLYAKRQADKFKRLAKYSLDEDNREQYHRKIYEWDYQADWMSKIKSLWNEVGSNALPSFRKQMSGMHDEHTREILQQAIKRVTFDKSTRKNSYFSRKDGVIYLAKNATPTTIAHELFHEIDSTYRITDKGALSKQLQSDFKMLIKTADNRGKTVENMLYSRYPEVFEEGRRGIKLKEEYRGISDILNGMSSGEIRLGYRHEDAYWERNKMLEKEAWAQYGRMLFQGDDKVLEFAEVLFPQTTAEIYQILKELKI